MPCPVGSEGCACTSENACNPGLRCLSRKCVDTRPEDVDANTTTLGGTTANPAEDTLDGDSNVAGDSDTAVGPTTSVEQTDSDATTTASTSTSVEQTDSDDRASSTGTVDDGASSSDATTGGDGTTTGCAELTDDGLLVNGSFETWGPTEPDAWDVYEATVQPRLSATDGCTALQASFNQYGQLSQVFTLAQPAPAGTCFELSGWGTSIDGGSDLAVLLEVRDGGGSTTIGETVSLSPQGAPFSAMIALELEGQELGIYLANQGGPRVMEFDGLSLQQLDDCPL